MEFLSIGHASSRWYLNLCNANSKSSIEENNLAVNSYFVM